MAISLSLIAAEALGRLEAQCERFVESGALLNEIFSRSAVLVARQLKVLQLFGSQRPDHIEPRAILEFLKAYPLTPQTVIDLFQA
jgi:hypothetical protein